MNRFRQDPRTRTIIWDDTEDTYGLEQWIAGWMLLGNARGGGSKDYLPRFWEFV